jgi:hypothetical protein
LCALLSQRKTHERARREDYPEVDWGSLTPLQADMMLEFATVLNEIRRNQIALAWEWLHYFELQIEAMMQGSKPLPREILNCLAAIDEPEPNHPIVGNFCCADAERPNTGSSAEHS